MCRVSSLIFILQINECPFPHALDTGIISALRLFFAPLHAVGGLLAEVYWHALPVPGWLKLEESVPFLAARTVVHPLSHSKISCPALHVRRHIGASVTEARARPYNLVSHLSFLSRRIISAASCFD